FRSVPLSGRFGGGQGAGDGGPVAVPPPPPEMVAVTTLEPPLSLVVIVAEYVTLPPALSTMELQLGPPEQLAPHVQVSELASNANVALLNVSVRTRFCTAPPPMFDTVPLTGYVMAVASALTVPVPHAFVAEI